MTNEDQVNKGRKAKQLLEDETLNTAIAKLENDQLWVFRSSKPEESVKRETAWCMLQAIDGLKQELTKKSIPKILLLHLRSPNLCHGL